MGRKTNTARGIRLSNELWDAIAHEAAGLGMSQNEFLSRRLTTLLCVAAENRKSVIIDRATETVLFKEVSDDDD